MQTKRCTIVLGAVLLVSSPTLFGASDGAVPGDKPNAGLAGSADLKDSALVLQAQATAFQIKQKEDEIAALRKEHETALQKVQTALEMANTEKTQLNTEKATLTTQLNSLSEQLSKLETQLQDAISGHTKAITELEGKSEKAKTEEIKRLQEVKQGEIDRLNTDLQAARIQLNRLADEKNKAENATKTKETDIASLSVTATNLQKKLSDAQAAETAAVDAKNTTLAEKKTLEAQLAALGAKNNWWFGSTIALGVLALFEAVCLWQDYLNTSPDNDENEAMQAPEPPACSTEHPSTPKPMTQTTTAQTSCAQEGETENNVLASTPSADAQSVIETENDKPVTVGYNISSDENLVTAVETQTQEVEEITKAPVAEVNDIANSFGEISNFQSNDDGDFDDEDDDSFFDNDDEEDEFEPADFAHLNRR